MFKLPANLIGIIVTTSVYCILFAQNTTNAAEIETCHECCEYYCFDLDRKKYQSRNFGVKTAYSRVKDSELIKPYAGSRNFVN